MKTLFFCLAVTLAACTHRQEKPPRQTDSLQLVADLANLPPPPPVNPNISDSFLIKTSRMRNISETDSDFRTEWVWKKTYIDSLERDYNSVFVAVEQMPEFPGGFGELIKYISKNLSFPKGCFGENMQGFGGSLFFQFVVNEKGKITNAAMPKGCWLDAELDRKIINQIFKNMPRWKPGRQNGKPVAVRYSMPMCILIRPE